MALDLPDLGKQVGPLPLGAWVAVVGGSFAFMLYQRNRSDTSAPTTTSLDTLSGDSIGSVGVGGMGAIGAYTGTNGGPAMPADATDTITSNTQWGQKVFSFLAGQGNDAATIDKAVRDYLAGKPLSVQANAFITQGLAKFGQAPEALPDAPDIPVVVQPAPAPVYTPPPPPAPVTVPAPAPPPPAPAPAPAGPPGEFYTIRPGDTLSGIAARFWQPWITAQSLFNGNRQTISNINRIYPGQVIWIQY